MNKLDETQALVKDKNESPKAEAANSGQTADKCTAPTEVSSAPPLQQAVMASRPVAPNKMRVLHATHLLARSASKQILKQAATITHMASNHSVASTTNSAEHGSLLGLALVFLIVGVVLFFLGFGSLGTLFWTIGVILLVVALIFFLLWMVNRSME